MASFLRRFSNLFFGGQQGAAAEAHTNADNEAATPTATLASWYLRRRQWQLERKDLLEELDGPYLANMSPSERQHKILERQTASLPYCRWLEQVELEETRLREKWAACRLKKNHWLQGSHLRKMAEDLVCVRWKEQGIDKEGEWFEGPDPVPEGLWKHQAVMLGKEHATPQEICLMDTSRPFYQFLKEVAAERDHLEFLTYPPVLPAEFRDGDVSHPPNPVPDEDLHSYAYWRVRTLQWVPRGLWRREWGDVPGMFWQHEVPIRDTFREHSLPLRRIPDEHLQFSKANPERYRFRGRRTGVLHHLPSSIVQRLNEQEERASASQPHLAGEGKSVPQERAAAATSSRLPVNGRGEDEKEEAGPSRDRVSRVRGPGAARSTGKGPAERTGSRAAVSPLRSPDVPQQGDAVDEERSLTEARRGQDTAREYHADEPLRGSPDAAIPAQRPAARPEAGTAPLPFPPPPPPPPPPARVQGPRADSPIPASPQQGRRPAQEHGLSAAAPMAPICEERATSPSQASTGSSAYGDENAEVDDDDDDLGEFRKQLLEVQRSAQRVLDAHMALAAQLAAVQQKRRRRATTSAARRQKKSRRGVFTEDSHQRRVLAPLPSTQRVSKKKASSAQQLVRSIESPDLRASPASSGGESSASAVVINRRHGRAPTPAPATLGRLSPSSVVADEEHAHIEQQQRAGDDDLGALTSDFVIREDTESRNGEDFVIREDAPSDGDVDMITENLPWEVDNAVIREDAAYPEGAAARRLREEQIPQDADFLIREDTPVVDQDVLMEEPRIELSPRARARQRRRESAERRALQPLRRSRRNIRTR